MSSPLFGPLADNTLPYRVYSDGAGPDGLWQYQSADYNDACDCAWSLFLDNDYTAVYITHSGGDVFRVDAQMLNGAPSGPRSRPSALADMRRHEPLSSLL